MSEGRAEYIVDRAGAPLLCPMCGAEIGTIYDTPKGYRLYLKGSPTPQYAIHGECPECGETLHWTGNDEFLRRRVLKGQ